MLEKKIPIQEREICDLENKIAFYARFQDKYLSLKEDFVAT